MVEYLALPPPLMASYERINHCLDPTLAIKLVVMSLPHHKLVSILKHLVFK